MPAARRRMWPRRCPRVRLGCPNVLSIPDDLGPSPAPESTKAAMEAIADGLDGPSGVPMKRSGNLLVGTWNIAAFGGLAKGGWETGPNDSPKRNLTNLCCIAEVISRFDVCAIQETKPELTALRTLARALGPDWSFIVSDVTLGDPGNYERLSFVYDRRRVKASGLVGEVVIPKEELGVKGSLDRQFARTPYAVSFTAGNKGFTLVTLHVLYGETKAEKQRRAKELAKIAEWLDARANEPDEFNRNLIVLGDFNIDRPRRPLLARFRIHRVGRADSASGGAAQHRRLKWRHGQVLRPDRLVPGRQPREADARIQGGWVVPADRLHPAGDDEPLQEGAHL